ncbi:hypothetical protein QUW14_02450 [Bacteroides gallinaceum]|uniref:hypothetical protein n=1 Tax=Bacteroides gallinaceum TaxID=1462571 RepID=UPI0025A3C90B|nr:hypothetical protein [Bacteroides gallinaceum]MDM8153186.1 hypothetical protein [Bacteroides gallinaceum]
MKELLKEQYEAPATKRTRVEMENGICQASVPVRPGDDVGKDRHVSIAEQKDGGDFEFGDTKWE